MGFKASMVLIKPAAAISETEILQQLGLGNFGYLEDTTLKKCMYPRDKSMNFGIYNGCLVICDNYRLTASLDKTKALQELAPYEKGLTNLFPSSEILTIACHSVVNYHLYALALDGKRIRYKAISGDTPLVEYGERLEEEIEIYKASTIIDGVRMFKSEFEEAGEYEYTEDQLMEDFAFGVAARHLGVKISMGDDRELMFNVPFHKYKKPWWKIL